MNQLLQLHSAGIQAKRIHAAPARLCLNMIVKNEALIIEHCLTSVADHVASWVIGDTGSTDGTPALIERFFAARGIPGELHRFPFEHFAQARNESLKRARASTLDYDYLLLVDADMELVVHDLSFRLGLGAPAYRVIQRAAISYPNLRLIARDVQSEYQGVTHEYLSIQAEGIEKLSGISFIDHACGSNRADKYARDIRLLLDGIAAEPDNARYHFYLAESYRYSGRHAEAARVYAHRASLGGWEEEAWYAMLGEARCLRVLGCEDEAVGKALMAFERRPHRAEPLRDVAHHYRMRGMNHVAALVAERGLDISYPENDSLFIEDDVYNGGLDEDYAISAWYSTSLAQKARGGRVCSDLSLSRRVPAARRDMARRNLAFYACPLPEMIGNVHSKRLQPTLDPGWSPLNPSVALWRGELWVIQRSVNYTLAGGHYTTLDGGPIATRNFLARLDADLDIASWAEILPPPDQPEPLYAKVLGFEDMRLIALDDELWCSATLRDANREGWCEQVLARIAGAGGDGSCRLADLRRISSTESRRHEKNWTPQVTGGELRFVYTYENSVVVSREGTEVRRQDGEYAADHLRGGSQAVPFAGGWLAICHEVAVDTRRRYLHRFAWFDAETVLARLGMPFKLGSEDIEFVAGLAPHPDGRGLVVSYGSADRESWLAVVPATGVAELLGLKAPKTANAQTGADGHGQGSAPRRGPAASRPDAAPPPASDGDAPISRHIVWIASYPKSGNTWVRAFLHALLAETRGAGSLDINRLHEHTAWETPAASFERVMGKRLAEAAPAEIAAARPAVQRLLAASHDRPFLVKTHNAFVRDAEHPTINLAATLAAVCVVRNPLDVAISYAHHSGRTLDETIRFMAHKGLRSTRSERSAYEVLGSWSESVAGWIGLAERPVHLVRYEDLLVDPVRHFGMLARFLGLPHGPEQLRAAVERVSFARLAEQEISSGFRERPPSSNRFFRIGREGQWRDTLSEAQVRRMLDAHAPMMQRLGYLEPTCGLSAWIGT